MTTSLPQCLAPTRAPRRPDTMLPAGSVDTHVHVFDGRYRLSPQRGYDPPDSRLEHMVAMHKAIGIERVVFTQPSIYGTDNGAILDGSDALNEATPGRARSVVAVGSDVSDRDLAAMHARGARGVRLNTDNVGGMPIDWDDLPELCRRIAGMGWHVEFLFPGRDMVELAPLIASLPVPACIGHFAYQPAADGVEADGFQALLALLRGGNTWLKISGADRVSAAGGPGYDDVAPLAEAALEANPERIMWGTDWPHPNKYDAGLVPDEGDLVDTLGSWVSDPDLLRRILVDTPEQFYGF
ncbi:MAG: amidohydrolase family protein [Acidimicrobiaceae bacterium]|nr:amidohydrolase family protein [Acidimicrobiaceae bacterium]MYL03159.1 amidohydrolase family protein [Acidimicrobiaceae bacterium]